FSGRRVRGVRKLPQPRIVRETRRDLLEWLTGKPAPCLSWIYVGEHSQDSSASRRPGGKRVHVQQVVAFFEWQVATLFFQWTKTGKVECYFLRVRRKQPFHEAGDLGGIFPHDALQLPVRGIVCAFALHAADLIRLRAIRDIFVETRLRLLLR